MKIFMPLLMALVLVGCAWQKDLSDTEDLKKAFESEFGFLPPGGVKVLHCRSEGQADTYTKWMAFSFDSPTVERLVRDGYSRATATDVRQSGALWRETLTSRGAHAPEWWRIPDLVGDLVVYYRDSHPADVSGYTVLWVDTKDSVVYAQSAAWH